jgi:hypothetical protein
MRQIDAVARICGSRQSQPAENTKVKNAEQNVGESNMVYRILIDACNPAESPSERQAVACGVSPPLPLNQHASEFET